MRITKQPSGGRGEYELSGTTTSNLRPIAFVDHVIHLSFAGIPIDTQLRVTNDQGKYRIRKVVERGPYSHIQMQVANILMLPPPIRDESAMIGGMAVLQNEAYIIKHTHLEDVEKTDDNRLVAKVSTIDCQNQTVHGHVIAIAQRISEIRMIWNNKHKFPEDIANLLTQHETLTLSGGPPPKKLGKIITDLQEVLERHASDLETPYSRRTDPVPMLLSVLNNIIGQTPLPLDQFEPEQIDLRRREIKLWRQFARRRGAASVKFKSDVRSVYNWRCVMCGVRFPPTSINSNPGIDAAHILPWAAYDLDKVFNGIALCKLHHWAFDEGLLVIVYRDGYYYIELSERAGKTLQEPEFSLEVLKEVVGKIPDDRLPPSRADRPRPELLQKLAEDVD